MSSNLVAVATITWARTPAEEAVLRRSLEHFSHAALPVAVADTGTSPRFTEFLAHLPGFTVTVPATRGLVTQVTASLQLAAALETPFILYTEPDKELFLGGPVRDFVRRALERADEHDLSLMLASRTEASFSTYPPMQRYTERVINELCGALVGSPGDYSFGPFLFSRELLPHLRALPQDLGWGWRHFAFREAHRLGMRVTHVAGDYPCPPDQRVEDDAERVHRLRQLSENIRGLIAHR